MAHVSEAREPLIHLSKRPPIHPLKAWLIRLAALQVLDELLTFRNSRSY